MNWLQKIAQGWYGSQKGYWLALWVDPSGKIYDIEDAHHTWIDSNRELLLEEYNIDIEQIEQDAYEAELPDNLEGLRKELISDHAFALEIDESQVVLTEEEEEDLYNQASDSTDLRMSGVALVDLLIKQGWLRVGKRTVIHIEGDEALPRFFDRAEMVLVERFPDVWKNRQHSIVINDAEIYSGDLQDAGNLEAAVRKSERITNYYMMNR